MYKEREREKERAENAACSPMLIPMLNRVSIAMEDGTDAPSQ